MIQKWYFPHFTRQSQQRVYYQNVYCHQSLMDFSANVIFFKLRNLEIPYHVGLLMHYLSVSIRISLHSFYSPYLQKWYFANSYMKFDISIDDNRANIYKKFHFIIYFRDLWVFSTIFIDISNHLWLTPINYINLKNYMFIHQTILENGWLL